MMTGMLFARAFPSATSAKTVSIFAEDIAKNFGWPRAVYHDNVAHFEGSAGVARYQGCF